MFLFNTTMLFILGFGLLIYGADILVRGALGIARRLNVSEWAAGVLLLGIGTSIPELTIMVTAAYTESMVGIGTIIGSNTFNMLFVLGAAALITPLTFEKKWLLRDMPILLAATLVTAFFLTFPIIGHVIGISRGEGIFLLLCGVLWTRLLLYPNQPTNIEQIAFEKPKPHEPYMVLVLLIIGGTIAVLFGGMWVVSGATAFARFFGVSETLIGLSLVSIGTSLPELAVTLSAARKGSVGLAAGNIIGSNTFNFLGILPLAAVLAPGSIVEDGLLFDIAVTGIATVACFSLVAFEFLPPYNKSKKNWFLRIFRRDQFRLSRTEGGILVLLYLFYLAALIVRG